MAVRHSMRALWRPLRWTVVDEGVGVTRGRLAGIEEDQVLVPVTDISFLGRLHRSNRHARYFSDLLHSDVHLSRVDRAARRADCVRAARTSQRSVDALVR